jgi:outer membrane receptor protein involved in Fe transport
MPQAVRQMDVYKGPTSALYGNFALAGTVNVRTLERMEGTDMALEGGSYGKIEGSLLTGIDKDQTGAVFGFRGVREDGWRPNSWYSLGQGHARVVHDLTSSTSIDAGVELYAASWESPGFITAQEYAAGDYNEIANPTDGGFKHHGQERVSLRVLSGSNMIWRSTLYATQGRWQLFLTTPPEGGATEGSGSQVEEEDHRYGFGATSALTWTLPRGEVTVGVEGRWDHSHYENYFTTSRSRDSAQVLVTARQASGALFLESTYEALRRLSLTVGGRYETQGTESTPTGGSAVSDTKGVFVPKFGALYRIPGFGGVYANVSKGYRRTDGVIEDPTVPFITDWAYEGGVKLNLSRVTASAALFQVDVSNEQTFDPITLSTTSGGKSRRKGLELGLQARLTPALNLTGDFTAIDAKYQTLITEDGDTLSGSRIFNTARFVGSFALGVAPPKSFWNVRVSSNLVGPYTPFDEPGVELTTYALLHLSGGLRFGHTLVTLGVRNVLDDAYPELRAGGFVSPGQPRSFYGSARYVF